MHIDIDNSLHYFERQLGICDLSGSYTRYKPGSQYENKSARYIASARYITARYIASALYYSRIIPQGGAQFFVRFYVLGHAETFQAF